MTHEEEIKCDLITAVLTIIDNHTREIEIGKTSSAEYVPPSEYPKMYSEIEDLR